MRDRDTLLEVRDALWQKLEIANQMSTENHQSGLKQALNVVQRMLSKGDRKTLN
jgi:hypothetical protein